MKTNRKSNALSQRKIIKNIILESDTLTELLIKFDLHGISYKDNYDLFRKIYSSVNWVATKMIIKDNNIIDSFVDEKFCRNIIYNCWVSGIKTTPYDRMLTQIWLEKHPEFKN